MKLGPDLPETKELKDVQQQSADSGDAPPQEDPSRMPPVIRSVLELTHGLMSFQSVKLRMCPGYQGGLFFNGKPFCFACGFRDGTRGLVMDDKGNHLRLKDPCGVGTLGVPVMAMLAAQLHDEGRLRMTQPLIELLPDHVAEGLSMGSDANENHALLDQYRHLTPLSVLSFTARLDEAKIYKQCGVSPWCSSPRLLPLTSLKPAADYFENVTEKVNNFYGHGIPGHQMKKKEPSGNKKISTVSSLSHFRNNTPNEAPLPSSHDLPQKKIARMYRDNFLRYLGSSRGSIGVQHGLRVYRRMPVPHFTLALLTSALEQALPNSEKKSSSGGSSFSGPLFEDAIYERCFRPLQALSAGYGAPLPWRDPNSTFYTPTGQAAGHISFSTPVTLGSPRNAGPPLFNASMNMYAPIEELGALVMSATDMTHKAYTQGREELMAPSSARSSDANNSANNQQPSPSSITTTASASEVRYGLWYDARMNTYFSMQQPTTGLDYLPFSASLRYHATHDLGTFAVTNSGMRRSRFFARTCAKATETLFINNIIKKGVKVESEEAEKDVVDKVEKLQKKKRPFEKETEAHRRF